MARERRKIEKCEGVKISIYQVKRNETVPQKNTNYFEVLM